jgi:hypothetical protein
MPVWAESGRKAATPPATSTAVSIHNSFGSGLIRSECDH